jgi:D-alanine-D-alanine ligase
MNILHKNKSTIIREHNSNRSHVVVLMGGESKEREVSLSSGNGIINSLIEMDYKITAIDIGYDIAEILLKLNPDIVFIALHGTFGEDGNIQGILNVLRIPYTHSGLTSSAISFNKVLTKKMLNGYDIKMANSIVYPKGESLPDEEPLKRPFVIKPSCEGSSVGVQIIFENDDFKMSDYPRDKFGEILIEDYIPGQEINVAVLDGKAIGALEIKTNHRFYDYEAKYVAGESEHIYPALLSEKKYKEVLLISEKIFKILGCNDVARVEFKYNPDDENFYFLEINTHPGFTPTSIVPEICAHNKISYNNLVEKLVQKSYAVKL